MGARRKVEYAAQYVLVKWYVSKCEYNDGCGISEMYMWGNVGVGGHGISGGSLGRMVGYEDQVEMLWFSRAWEVVLCSGKSSTDDLSGTCSSAEAR